jgi:long-chain acyl-CoA synthetase
MSEADILAGLPDRISEVIVRHVAERPTHPAFVESGCSWSYREFADVVDAVADDFVRLQIRPGDRVLLASENSVALASFIFACSTLDAWPVVVNPRLSPRELDQIHVHSGALRILMTAEVSREAAGHAVRLGAELRELVVQFAVIGRAVSGNEEVVAFVQLLPGAAIDAAELMRYAAGQLTSYKRPVRS